MPLYEYACAKCGKHIERIEKFSGPNIKKCPTCGGRLERLMSAPAIQFKGSGWYVTDYAHKSSGPDDKKGGGESEKQAGKSESQSGEKGAPDSKESRESRDSRDNRESKDSKSSKESKDKKKSDTKKK